jgi:hypothetical protein
MSQHARVRLKLLRMDARLPRAHAALERPDLQRQISVRCRALLRERAPRISGARDNPPAARYALDAGVAEGN